MFIHIIQYTFSEELLICTDHKYLLLKYSLFLFSKVLSSDVLRFQANATIIQINSEGILCGFIIRYHNLVIPYGK